MEWAMAYRAPGLARDTSLEVIAVDLRPGPSANLVLVGGERPVLVDSGSGSVASLARTHAFLASHGLAAGDLAWLALTHFHADHAGGAASLGVPVAAHAIEAALVNDRDPRACDAAWLAFDVGPYVVSRCLEDGDVLEGLEVVHTPGQTPGHVAYWHPQERVAITGDLLQAGDVAWVPFGGPWADGALDAMIASIKRIAALAPRMTIPGHGPPVTDVPAAVAANLERYERFRAEPERAVWHAVRRALVSHLMIEPRPASALAAMPWAESAASALGVLPLALVERALGGLAERGLVVSQGGRFDTTIGHEERSPLAVRPGDPTRWPAI
jgi:glyoxylase-like metal-dependent hydrolase (beta-lactamase superfamily II)